MLITLNDAAAVLATLIFPAMMAACATGWNVWRVTLRMRSATLKAVISQRLIPRIDGKGRVPAVEVMLGTARVRDCIDDKDKTKQIPEAIAQGFVSYGMQSFDQSLMQLFTKKFISYDEAMRQSSNPDDFALKISGISSTSNSTWDQFDQGGAEAAKEEGGSPLAIDKF